MEPSSARELSFSWTPVDEALQNGMIINYSIACSPPHLPALMVEDLEMPSYRVTLSGFIPATKYTCSIRAVSLDGSGPPASHSVTTPEAGTDQSYM